jgi:hypothetical protein
VPIVIAENMGGTSRGPSRMYQVPVANDDPSAPAIFAGTGFQAVTDAVARSTRVMRLQGLVAKTEGNKLHAFTSSAVAAAPSASVFSPASFFPAPW